MFSLLSIFSPAVLLDAISSINIFPMVFSQEDHVISTSVYMNESDHLREVKRSFLMFLNSVLVGCRLTVVPNLITPSRLSCCQVLGGAFAMAQDQSLFAGFLNVPGLSFITASFDLK